ncbi:ATP-binding protein [Streptomyces oceani]|uniref:Histidine kinase/HSP90-like ATPase domain-containing protein n=1 Tax=Streptomyces oceani TaxID=1075402 RepID=A0A1E7KFQ2_9ACTN|nr:ATP-binding protein [Streptomyces oceani]OEV02736.1 hypothetical protein AN216_14825 [Streptomyces oceani]
MTEEPLPQPPRQYRVTLTVGDHSPRHLRRVARAHTRAWGLEQLADAAELALTELTTNVHRHTPDRWCVVTLIHTLTGLRIEVYDHSPIIPVPLRADELAESGRGLALVALLTDKWDVTLHRIGKTVWCELLDA